MLEIVTHPAIKPGSHLFLLLLCTAIAGYHLSSDNSNSQQQPIAGYKQK